MDRLVIFSDLDGTLLDADTYSFEQALPALDLVRERDIPLVLVSSKTRAELEIWRTRLGTRHPFVSENGGGIFIPGGSFPFSVGGETYERYQLIRLGLPYTEVRKRFVALRERLGIKARGFGDMTVNDVAELTGLSLGDAALAKQRDFGEPFMFDGEPQERFLLEIEKEKLRWTQGRFFHIMGDHHKGRAAELMAGFYRRRYGAVTTVGIGDSLNDLPFLLAVDRPALVKKKTGKHDERINIPGLVRTQGIGPAGWNEAVMALLGELR